MLKSKKNHQIKTTHLVENASKERRESNSQIEGSFYDRCGECYVVRVDLRSYSKCYHVYYSAIGPLRGYINLLMDEQFEFEASW